MGRSPEPSRRMHFLDRADSHRWRHGGSGVGRPCTGATPLLLLCPRHSQARDRRLDVRGHSTNRPRETPSRGRAPTAQAASRLRTRWDGHGRGGEAGSEEWETRIDPGDAAACAIKQGGELRLIGPGEVADITFAARAAIIVSLPWADGAGALYAAWRHGCASRSTASWTALGPPGHVPRPRHPGVGSEATRQPVTMRSRKGAIRDAPPQPAAAPSHPPMEPVRED